MRQTTASGRLQLQTATFNQNLDLITKLRHALSDLWPSIKSSIRRIAIFVLARHPTQSTMSIKPRRVVRKKSPLLITQDPEPS
jgi:hypothetical protein